MGQKGVGKSTMLLQHIKKFDKLEETLYVTADNIYFSGHTLYDLAQSFFKSGGKRLYIDEIHKYKPWSTEIKNIYDDIPLLQVIYSGSSLLALQKGNKADLSRRPLHSHLDVRLYLLRYQALKKRTTFRSLCVKVVRKFS